MKLKEAFLWQPGGFHQRLMLIAGALLVTAIGYLHMLTGLTYEFHAIFVGGTWLVGELRRVLLRARFCASTE